MKYMIIIILEGYTHEDWMFGLAQDTRQINIFLLHFTCKIIKIEFIFFNKGEYIFNKQLSFQNNDTR